MAVRKEVLKPMMDLSGVSCIVGLDLSLTRTGVCILPRDLEGQECSSFSSGEKGVKRLSDLRTKLLSALGSRVLNIAKRDPSGVLVVFENYAFQAHGQTFNIGEWGGVARLAIHDLGMPMIGVAPCKLKKFVTGKGNVEKGMIIKEVFRRWQAEPANNDEADAYGLARYGHCLCSPQGYSDFQIEATKEFTCL